MITSFDQLDLSKQYTYADYMTWQFQDRVELIRGWIRRMSPAPMRIHQKISGLMYTDISNYLKGGLCEAYAAPFDVRLTNKRKSTDDKSIISVVQPDICVICNPDKLDDRGCIGAPDWIIEILSSGNTKKEMADKFSLYEENGVREYWIVSPANLNIQVYDLVDDQFVYRNTYQPRDLAPVGIFAGLKIDCGKLFDGVG